MQSHVDECPLCEGPCRPGFHLPPIHARYPFMTPEQIAATQPEPEPEPVEPAVRAGRRRRVEDRMRRLAETTAHEPAEDR
jgi:hypothetical protein